jgi:uncharacterized protein (TIGR03382 family)
VLFNGTDEEQRFSASTFKDARLELHPVLKESTDPIARSSAFDAGTGTFTVPARTTAVFMQGQPPSRQVPVSGSVTESSGCSAGGGAAFSALALLMGLGALRRSRRRTQ